jgi:hypothetical protein
MSPVHACAFSLTDELTSDQSRFRADWLNFYWQTSLELHVRVCHRNVIAIDPPSARRQVFKDGEGKDDQLAVLW